MPHQLMRFAATSASFEQAATDFRTALEACGAAGRALHSAELIFEEVVSNVIRHGNARTITASIAMEPPGPGLVLTFEDDGPPFDPLARPMPSPPTSLDEAPLGGLGLTLVRKASSQLHYERTPDDANRLTVIVA